MSASMSFATSMFASARDEPHLNIPSDRWLTGFGASRNRICKLVRLCTIRSPLSHAFYHCDFE